MPRDIEYSFKIIITYTCKIVIMCYMNGYINLINFDKRVNFV